MVLYEQLSSDDAHDDLVSSTRPSFQWRIIRDKACDVFSLSMDRVKAVDWWGVGGAGLVALGVALGVVFVGWWAYLFFGGIWSALTYDGAAAKAALAKEGAEKVATYLKPIIERLDRLEKLDRLDDILTKLEGIEHKMEL